ncbi:hypothetical protein, partial [Bacillus sp. SIMBA_005]|uniref:hypothetical protein n=1 Tax=Bacillus sp. SIMBA_005 TaxID=3085754 RepID=UPI00397B60E7
QWGADSFTEVTHSLTHQHVLKALEEIDQQGVPAGADSTRYDLVYEGRRYPPKLVLELSAKVATGSDLSRREFKGGEESRAFKTLRNLGFQIEA